MSRSDDASLDVEWYESQTAHRTDDPQLTIYTNLNGYINAAADRQYFEDYDDLDIGFVTDEYLLVLRPADDGRYALSREDEKGKGADIHVTSAIKHAWGDPGLEETQQVPIREAGGHIVADLSDLVGDDGDDASLDQSDDAPDTPEAEADSENTVDVTETDADSESALPGGELDEYHTSQPLVEEYLVHAVTQGDRQFTSGDIADAVDGDLGGRAVGATLRQLKTAETAPLHVTKSDERQNGTAVWHIEPEVDLFDDAETDTEADDVAETLQAADDADSVQALANALEVSPGRARVRARDAGVYGDLDDNVPRPGVNR
jgi:hypothetical protein